MVGLVIGLGLGLGMLVGVLWMIESNEEEAVEGTLVSIGVLSVKESVWVFIITVVGVIISGGMSNVGETDVVIGIDPA